MNLTDDYYLRESVCISRWHDHLPGRNGAHTAYAEEVMRLDSCKARRPGCLVPLLSPEGHGGFFRFKTIENRKRDIQWNININQIHRQHWRDTNTPKISKDVFWLKLNCCKVGFSPLFKSGGLHASFFHSCVFTVHHQSSLSWTWFSLLFWSLFVAFGPCCFRSWSWYVRLSKVLTDILRFWFQILGFSGRHSHLVRKSWYQWKCRDQNTQRVENSRPQCPRCVFGTISIDLLVAGTCWTFRGWMGLGGSPPIDEVWPRNCAIDCGIAWFILLASSGFKPYLWTQTWLIGSRSADGALSSIYFLNSHMLSLRT